MTFEPCRAVCSTLFYSQDSRSSPVQDLRVNPGGSSYPDICSPICVVFLVYVGLPYCVCVYVCVCGGGGEPVAWALESTVANGCPHLHYIRHIYCSR